MYQVKKDSDVVVQKKYTPSKRKVHSAIKSEGPVVEIVENADEAKKAVDDVQREVTYKDPVTSRPVHRAIMIQSPMAY